MSKWQAALPSKVRPVLWGPLQAKEMGLEGWDVQDGGETGLVYHRHGRAATGHVTATLIVVNRLRQAFLTIYLGGYPVDAPEAQRRLEAQRVVSAAQAFLGRLVKDTVSFEMQGELALVDNVNDAVEARMLGGRLRRSGAVEEA